MERPKITDATTLKYVENLEKQIQNFKSDLPTAKLYRSKLEWVDYIIKLQQELIQERESEDKADRISSKDDDETIEFKKEKKAKSIDRMLDRCLRIQEDILKTAKDLKELESLTNPQMLIEAEREAGSDYEARLNKLNG